MTYSDQHIWTHFLLFTSKSEAENQALIKTLFFLKWCNYIFAQLFGLVFRYKVNRRHHLKHYYTKCLSKYKLLYWLFVLDSYTFLHISLIILHSFVCKY